MCINKEKYQTQQFDMATWLIVTGSVKRGLIADPSCTYLESHNLTSEFSTILKFGPDVPLTYHYCLV